MARTRLWEKPEKVVFLAKVVKTLFFMVFTTFLSREESVISDRVLVGNLPKVSKMTGIIGVLAGFWRKNRLKQPLFQA